MTTAVATRQIVAGVLQGAVAVAYPILIWLGLTRFQPRVLALLVLGFGLIRFAMARRGSTQSSAAAIRSLALPAILIGSIIGAVLIWNDEIGLLLMPVAISLAFLFAFGVSLFRGPPMVERFARLQVTDLSPEEIAYCRRVTWVWCGFFVLNAGVAGFLASARLTDAWVLYTGLISYVLMGLLFAGEYLYRHWRFRRYVGAFTDPLLKRVFPPREVVVGEVAASLRAESRLIVSDRDQRQLEWRVPEALAVWPGHFPNQALVPGVLELEWIIREIEKWEGASFELSRVERLKFKAPIFPGDRVFGDLRADRESESGATYRVELRVRDEQATSLRLVAKGAAGSDETPEASPVPADEWSTKGAARAWPAPSDLIPHSGEMLWLHSVLDHSEDETVCRVRTEDLRAFRDSAGAGGGWLSLEWMAQAVAAHDGIRRHSRGEAIRPGMLLGTKKLELWDPVLHPALEYAVRVRHVFGGESGMVSYDAEVFRIDSGRLQAKARLACRVGTPGAPLV